MNENDFDFLDYEDSPPEPYWTARRVVYIIVILITLIAFLVYTLSPLFFNNPAPFLPEPPRNMV
jgi:hypothetical protein